jgi:hypothetical protein
LIAVGAPTCAARLGGVVRSRISLGRGHAVTLRARRSFVENGREDRRFGLKQRGRFSARKVEFGRSNGANLLREFRGIFDR